MRVCAKVLEISVIKKGKNAVLRPRIDTDVAKATIFSAFQQRMHFVRVIPCHPWLKNFFLIDKILYLNSNPNPP